MFRVFAKCSLGIKMDEFVKTLDLGAFGLKPSIGKSNRENS